MSTTQPRTRTATRRRPGRGRMADYAVNSVIVLVILVCAAWLLPSVLGYDRYVITGGSMSGSIERGAIAFERQVPVGQLQVGDVITYQPPPASGTTSLVTHRIASIDRGEKGERVFRTKGDANASVDPWDFRLTNPTQPVVQFTVPYAGHAFIALADRQVRMLVIGLPAALVALLALRDLLKALRRSRGPEAAEPATVAELVA